MKPFLKKLLILCMAAGTCALTACGEKITAESPAAESAGTSAAEPAEQTEAAASETQPETTAAAQDDTETETEPAEPLSQSEAYHKALQNTFWSGCDAFAQSYVFAFGEEKLGMYCSDGSKLESWWDVKEDESGLFFYSDAGCTQELTMLPWSYDADHQIMMIRDVVLLPTEGTDADSIQNTLKDAALIQDSLQGCWWGGANDAKSEALAFTLNEANLSALTCENGGEPTPFMGFWGMNADTFVLYNENYEPFRTYHWSQDDASVLKLTDENGAAVSCGKYTDADTQAVGEQLKTALQ